MNRFSNLLSAKLPIFYGYVVLLVALAASVSSSPGQTYAISVFTPHLEQALELSTSQLAAAYMLGTFLAAIPLAAVGPLADRCGLRLTTAFVSAGMAAACWIASRADSFAAILLAFFLLRFLGQGSLTLLSGNIVSMWFRKNLGTVNAIMWAGSAIAFAVIPLALLNAIEQWGWRTAYLAMGALILVVMLPLVVLLFRNRPEDVGQQLDGIRFPPASCDSTQPLRAAEPAEPAPRAVADEPEFTLAQAARGRTFWILAIGLSLWAMIGTGLVFHAIPIFAQCGIPAEKSKLLFATFSVAMLLAQVVGGVLADRRAMHRLLAFGFALLLAGVVVVACTTQVWHMHLFAALFGAGQGLAVSVNSTMWARYYGRQHLGKIRGSVWCLTVAGSGCGPFVLGLFSDLGGSFTPGIWCFAVLLAPTPLLCLAATATEPVASHVPA